MSDSLLRHSRRHRGSSISVAGAAHNREHDAIHTPLNFNDQQGSPFNNTISTGAHGPPATPIQPIDSYGSEFQTESYSASVVQNPTAHLSNQAKLGGGVAGFPTPTSQPHLSRLDASLRENEQDESWIFGNPNTQTPAWFAGDDFDLSALNSEILMSTANWFPSEYGIQHRQENDIFNHSSPRLAEGMPPSLEEQVQTNWYTFMGASPTGQITPDMGPEQTQVDEAYRASLAAKLQPHMPVMPLPSTDFLVSFTLCISVSHADYPRISAFKCILPNSTPYFQSCTPQHSDHPQKAHYSCYPFAPLEVCLWVLPMLHLKDSSCSRLSTRQYCHLCVAPL